MIVSCTTRVEVQDSCPDFRDKSLACPYFPDPNSACPDFGDQIWRFQTFATIMIRRDFRDRSGGGATKTSLLIFAMSRLSRTRVAISRLSRLKNSGATFATEADTARPCGSGNGVTGAIKLSYFQTFQTKMETQFFRPTWRRRDFKKKIAGLSRPIGRRRDFRDQGGYIATQKATARPAWPARPEMALSSFSRRSGSGATFAFRVEAVRLSRLRRRRRDFPDQGGDSATFQTKTETTQFFRPRRRRRDQDLYSSRLRWLRCDFPDQSSDGMTLQTKAITAQHSSSRRRRRDFPDQGGYGATFRPRRKWRNFGDQDGDGATKNQFLATDVDTVPFSSSLMN